MFKIYSFYVFYKYEWKMPDNYNKFTILFLVYNLFWGISL